METKPNNYYKVKKPIAIGVSIAFGVILAAIAALAILNHIRLGELEAKINNSAAASFEGRGMRRMDIKNGEMPELPDGEAPAMSDNAPSGAPGNASDSSETPTLPESEAPKNS